MTYTPETLAHLSDESSRVNDKYRALLSEFASFTQTHAASYEYTFQGFMRRLGTLERCIQNVYSLYPPTRSDVPSRETCVDLAINLQSFVFNVFGCLDNLAWIWVTERHLTVKETQVGFRKDIIKRSFTDDFQTYLCSLDQWFAYLENYRHALAHRIPLYIAPFVVAPGGDAASFSALETQKTAAMRQRDFVKYDELDTAQQKLGKFLPAMTHSLYREDRNIVYFHGQLLADWNTVVEIAERFLRQSNW
jgi:hypothetical protein